MHYLEKVYQMWSTLFPGDEAAKVDAVSVRLIEGMMPTYSTDDPDWIRALMDDGSLFPKLTEQDNRERLKRALIEIPGRILSLGLFFNDTYGFCRPAHVLCELQPTTHKTSVRSLSLNRWNEGVSDGKFRIQESEHEYKDVPAVRGALADKAEELAAWMSFLQLWLVCFRHFLDPRDGRKRARLGVQPLYDLRGKPELHNAAEKLGFQLDETRQKAVADPNIPPFQCVRNTFGPCSPSRYVETNRPYGEKIPGTIPLVYNHPGNRCVSRTILELGEREGELSSRTTAE